MAHTRATSRDKLAIRLVALAAVCLVAAGCGRRGDPEAPPSAAVLSTDEQGQVVKGAPAPVEDRPFILDGLIQ